MAPGSSPPTLAIEIVADDWRKDYEQGPQKYAQLGADELLIFDPEAARGATRLPERTPLQVYVSEADGSFVRGFSGGGPAWSRVLGAWLTVVDGSEAPLLRLVVEDGRTLLPTEAEAREAERAAREAAEHRLAALEAELERIRRERVR
ncbi:MAG: hypothetical protein AMXMBFR64_09050 [Myxococcales bacterium]